jgi:hypothetical protein
MKIPHEWVAFHEAGHAIAAAVLGFPFRSSGIHIDADGLGNTQIVRPSRQCSESLSIREKQGRMVVVLFAGFIAQRSFDSESPEQAAEHDQLLADQYLGAIHKFDNAAKSIAETQLRGEAYELVSKHKDAIAHVAKQIAEQPETPRTEEWGSEQQQERKLETSALNAILGEHQLCAKIDDVTRDDDRSRGVD